MILKVRIHNGWMFISELYKVETRQMLKVDAQNLDIIKEFYCINEIEGDNSKWVTVYYLFNNKGLDKVIVTDINDVYLINNEGKTIEKLN